MNSKYIILFSHIKTIQEPKYINQVNIVYHNRDLDWCGCIRFFTHRFIHKKLTDKLITELVFKSRIYIGVGEWREKDTEEILERLIKENKMGHVIRRFEIKKVEEN